MKENNKIGYARVSTASQNLDSQIDMLNKAGCVKIFHDKISSVTSNRKGWSSLMDYIRPGDTIVVTELSRMTRSLTMLLDSIKELEQRGIEIMSLRENIDNSTAIGRAFIHIMGSIHQMEKELRAERAAIGRESARARGRSGGRPFTDPKKIEYALLLYHDKKKTVKQISELTGVAGRTIYKYLQEEKEAKCKESKN